MHYFNRTNLVALAEELDNFPAGDVNPYETLHSFPDEIMRKDVLDDLQPYGSRPLPRPPLVPSCQKCATDQVPYTHREKHFTLILTCFSAIRFLRKYAE